MKKQLTLAALAIATLSQAALSLDDPNKPKLGELNPFAEQDPQQEMRRLFKEVELRIDRMQSLLLSASAGETDALAELSESGMDDLFREQEGTPSSGSTGSSGESTTSASGGSGSGGSVAELLKSSRSHGGQVVKDIDRILEIAAQNGGT